MELFELVRLDRKGAFRKKAISNVRVRSSIMVAWGGSGKLSNRDNG
jgi:hypothetical protein